MLSRMLFTTPDSRKPRLSRFALPLAALFVTALPATAEAAEATGDTDLIVLILFDALRADHVSGYGYERPTTPHLDKMIAEGTHYTRAYVNAPWTRPSTASFLTGVNASVHKTETYTSKLAESVLTIAERLKRRGYRTAGFTANGNGGSIANLQQGFDVFEDTSKTYTRKMRGKTYCCNGLPTGEFIVRRATEWMQKDKSKKKFVFLFFIDPHDPYGAPDRLEKLMLGADFKGKVRRHALWERNNDYPDDERYSMMAIYDAGIRYADEALGQFVSYLQQRKLYRDATIIVTADHGEGFGEHGFYLHAHHFWEEVIHVPVVVTGAHFKGGGARDRLVDSIDLARTIAELGGASVAGLPGVSLLLPQATAKQQKKYVISEYNEFGIHRQAIIGERYKVIWQRPADEAWYLREAKKKEFFPSVSFDKEVVRVYDLLADPQEKKELAPVPPRAEKLLKILRQFVEP